MKASEFELKERIKELTCLYEVSTILGNANQELLEETLKAVAFSLKRAVQYPEHTNISFVLDSILILTGKQSNGELSIQSDIKVFNQIKGKLRASLDNLVSNEVHFLKEEQFLLDNIALKTGNLLERIEIQKNETSLKQQMERADRLTILGEITAGIAHELNTPLANILGFAELLKNDMDATSDLVKDVEKIIHNAIFSREVVKKLMFFACEMPQEMKRINLVPHIKNAINLLEATFKKEHVKYIVKVEEEEIWLQADPVQITQIIFNLLMNAIYFSPKEGLVTVEAFCTNKEIVLKILDEGKGFTKDEIDKVFQPFFTTKPIGDGSGLGLSVVHGIT